MKDKGVSVCVCVWQGVIFQIKIHSDQAKLLEAKQRRDEERVNTFEWLSEAKRTPIHTRWGAPRYHNINDGKLTRSKDWIGEFEQWILKMKKKNNE